MSSPTHVFIHLILSNPTFEAFGIHSNNYLQYGFKVLQQKSPYQMHLIFIHSLVFISSNFFCLHHPSSSTLRIIYPFLEQHVYSTKSLAQWSSTTLKKTYQQEEKLILENLAALFLHSTFYLTSHHQLCKHFFNATTPSTIHSSVQIMLSITHKQTRLLTHVFLALAMK